MVRKTILAVATVAPAGDGQPSRRNSSSLKPQSHINREQGMSNHRVVICEFCAGETDDGECPVCEGTRLAVIETQEIEMSDLDAMEPVS